MARCCSPELVVRNARLTVREILNQLEKFYGQQEPCWPSDPYLFLLWWYSGYPASDASCGKGWKELTAKIGTDPDAILGARPAALAAALKPGGMFPELRAERMKEVAARIETEFGGDLRAALTGSITKVRKILKSFLASPIRERTGYCCSLRSNPSPRCHPTAPVSWRAFRRAKRKRTTTQAIERPSA